MPLVVCPHCRYEQIVRREMLNLRGHCERCGHDMVLREPPPRKDERTTDGVPLQPVPILAGVGLVAILLVLVGGAFAGIVWATRRPDAPLAERSPDPVPVQAPKPAAAPDLGGRAGDRDESPRNPGVASGEGDGPALRGSPTPPPWAAPAQENPAGPKGSSGKTDPRPNPPAQGLPELGGQPGKKPGNTPPTLTGPTIEDRIPADAPPDLRESLRRNVGTIRSPKAQAADRVKAAAALGELGEKGRPAARFLCEAMLDRDTEVRTAAADALKRIDPEVHKDAVALFFDGVKAFPQLQRRGTKSEPLTPLVMHLTTTRSKQGQLDLGWELITLARIAPEDLDVCKFVVATLGSKDRATRNIAIGLLPALKHGRTGVEPLLAIFRAEPANLVAIRALAQLADDATIDAISKAISAQRYHPDAKVREEVDKAMAALEKKRK